MAVRADDVNLSRDRSLVELCQAGDERAFADLYHRYYRRLLRFCVRRVGDAHEAEEITQEAFARAFTAMPRFAGERRFYPWLTVIASRLCIDSHRRSARTEPSAEVDMGSVEGGQQQIIDNVDIEYLNQAMGQLGPRHREVLELRETHGWTYQQIANHYDVTMGTVEALLFRARKALRREFLSLAGDDHTLASLPFIGVILRGAATLRGRLNDAVTHGAAIAAGAASVAAVAGGIALAVPTHNASDHPVTHATAHVASARVDTPSVVAQPVGGASGAITRSTHTVRPTAAQLAVKPLSQGGAEQGHAMTAQDGSSITIAGVTLSTDLANPLGLFDLLK